jgi:death-on-curing protein
VNEPDSGYHWPDPRALLDELAEHMAQHGETLTVVSMDDLEAGLQRARLAEAYAETDLCALAALMFEGVATRHPLLDGNKRLAFLAMASFLILKGKWLDAPEAEIAHLCIAVVAKEQPVDALAAYLRAHC